MPINNPQKESSIESMILREQIRSVFDWEEQFEHYVEPLEELMASHRTAVLQEVLDKAPRDKGICRCLCEKTKIALSFNQANKEWRDIINNLRDI